MKKIAIFASGSGSNAQKIAEYFKENSKISINCILSNRKDSFVLERANQFNINSYSFDRSDFYETDRVLSILLDREIDFVVLAGFLWLIPLKLIQSYPNRIINIHPALLPNYGGKGMYGMKVHEAVVNAKEKESGITIHYVNEKYDDGAIIFQAKCSLDPDDSAEKVAQKVHALEYEHFPKIIEEVVSKL
jgi:phosphoribosylglycinamide formyltransferase 1